MFHWMCPECGREIAPGVKECDHCDPQAAGIPVVAGPVETSSMRLPEPLPAFRAPIRGASVDSLLGPPSARPRAQALKVALPQMRVQGTEPVPPAAGLESLGASGVSAAVPSPSPILAEIEPARILNGPRLPHELVSLDGAGISQVQRIVLAAPQPPAPSKIPGWVVTGAVTTLLVLGFLSVGFYAMPGEASPVPSPVSVEVVEATPVSSELVEVTGIRIISVAGRLSEIRYLVVNHTAERLEGATIQVTLRPRSAVNAATMARFTFTAPKLGPYGSHEMVNLIENVVASGPLPDWRELRADVEVER